MSKVSFICALVWFFGWGFLCLRCPVASFRIVALGRRPTPKDLRVVRVVGYMGVVFGCLLLLEVAFGLLSLQ